MNIRIRVATNQDRDDIRDIHLQSFPEEEGHLIAEFAGNLLSEESDPATVALVAEMGGEVVGHVAFSPVYGGVNSKCLGYILAPLAVKPRYRNTGIGTKLVEGGIARLSEMGVNLFLVYGDPKYYGRFGFGAEAASNFVPPYELKYPFGWLAILRSQEGSNEQAVQLSCVESLRNPALW
ncbi:MAG: N-acetyltransferase [Gammaproteobacteria bacterium]|nr:N-acetyltransferase [Gammaproteobacteria bacterium]